MDLDLHDPAQMEGYREARRIELAREHYGRFIKFTKPNYDFNWHHKIMARALDQFAKGELKRLIITAPPQTGKSEQTSRRLPPYIHGQNPDARILAASYGATLASRNNRDVQRIMEGQAYRTLFPEAQIAMVGMDFQGKMPPARNNTTYEIFDREGSYRCAGVGGSFTGMPADFFILDDPIKGPKEASSQRHLDSLWEWVATVMETRLHNDSAVLITMTRWTQGDPVGRFLRLMKTHADADKWTVIRFPGIFEGPSDDLEFAPHPEDPRQIGEALWPAKHSQLKYSKMRETMGPKYYNSVVQQRPAAQEGNIVKRSQIQFFKKMPERYDRSCQSWDCAFKGSETSSYVAGGVFVAEEAKFMVVDLIRARMDFNATIAAIKAMSAKWPKVLLKLIEDKANGPAIVSSLQSKIAGITAEPVEGGDKVARFRAVSPIFDAKQFYLPDPDYFDVPWVKDYIEELVTFPDSAFKDQVDMTSQALLRLWGGSQGTFSKEMIPAKPSTITGPRTGESQW